MIHSQFRVYPTYCLTEHGQLYQGGMATQEVPRWIQGTEVDPVTLMVDYHHDGELLTYGTRRGLLYSNWCSRDPNSGQVDRIHIPHNGQTDPTHDHHDLLD